MLVSTLEYFPAYHFLCIAFMNQNHTVPKPIRASMVVNYRWAKDPAASVLRRGSLPNGSLTPSPHAIPVVPTVLAR